MQLQARPRSAKSSTCFLQDAHALVGQLRTTCREQHKTLEEHRQAAAEAQAAAAEAARMHAQHLVTTATYSLYVAAKCLRAGTVLAISW